MRNSGLPEDDVKNRKPAKESTRTLYTWWTHELVDKINLDIRHIDTLRMIPLVTPRCIIHVNAQGKAVLRARNGPITRNHHPVFVILCLADTIQLVILLITRIDFDLRSRLFLNVRHRHNRCRT